MLQASLLDGLGLDPFAFGDDGRPAAEVDIGGREIAEALVVAGLVVMLDETGIHDAIARQLNEKGKLSKNAVAEGIINNIRKTIIRDQLTDPRFYDEMSRLLQDLIRRSRESAEAYEEFLRQAEDLIKRLASRTQSGGVPTMLHGNREAAVIFNNLATIPASSFVCPADDDEKAKLALEIDRTVRDYAPAGWKGDVVREREVKNVLFPLFNRDRDATLAMYEIIENQPGY